MSREQARKKLDELRIPYSMDEFVSRAEQGDVRVVKLFLGAGMSPNAKSNSGWTALWLASEADHADVVELLKRAGARASAWS
jgi:ankyrin repeat protein